MTPLHNPHDLKQRMHRADMHRLVDRIADKLHDAIREGKQLEINSRSSDPVTTGEINGYAVKTSVPGETITIQLDGGARTA